MTKLAEVRACACDSGRLAAVTSPTEEAQMGEGSIEVVDRGRLLDQRDVDVPFVLAKGSNPEGGGS